MGDKFVRTIGLMPGTSREGGDAAWIETDGVSAARAGMATTLHYEDTLRADLRQLLDLASDIALDNLFLLDLERWLTDDHAIACAMSAHAARDEQGYAWSRANQPVLKGKFCRSCAKSSEIESARSSRSTCASCNSRMNGKMSEASASARISSVNARL